MSEYTLEIKQIVDYPRCRIYRQFVQALIADRSIRVSGGSGLFLVSRKPLAGRVVQKRLLPMRKNKTPSVIVEMRSGNCKLQNKGRPYKNEVAETV